MRSDSDGSMDPLGELAADDLTAQASRDELGRLRQADDLADAGGRLAQRLTPWADHAAILALGVVNDK